MQEEGQAKQHPDDFFDKAFFLKHRVNNNLSIAKKLTEIFLDSYQKGLSDIKNAVETKDAEKLRATAHFFKGQVSYYSKNAAKASLNLEQAGKRIQFIHGRRAVQRKNR